MDLQMRYETQRKESEILKLKNQKNKEANTRIILIGALIMGFSITLFIFFWSRQKRINDRQKNNILKNENQLKIRQVENIKLEKQLKEQELFYQTLKKVNVEQINKSIKEKLVPFTTCLRRKKDQEEFSKVLKEITNILNLSLSTVDQRRHNIRKKLGLSGDQNLVSFLITI